MDDFGEQVSELQAQSDRTRIDFLRTDLQICFTFAALAETEFEAGERDNAKRSLEDAEKGYATVSRFTTDPRHASHIPPEVLHELVTQLRQLREALDNLAHRID